jgi:hypothetical protein
MADRGRRRWQGPKSGPCFCLLTSNRPFRLPSINLVSHAHLSARGPPDLRPQFWSRSGYLLGEVHAQAVSSM